MFRFVSILWFSTKFKDHRQWYKMIEVNGAYKHGRHEKIWFKCLCVMPTFNVFTKMDGQLAEHSWLYRSIH